MADGLSQPRHVGTGVRRGPPPPPRGAVDSQPSLLSPSAESAVDELLALIAAEAESHTEALTEKAEKSEKKKGSAVSDSEVKAKKRAADLKVRAALLAWDGRGDVQKALAFVDKVDHPLVPAIRLAAAIELKDDAMLQACIAETKKRGDKADLAELGALLFWRARDATHAAEVLAQRAMKVASRAAWRWRSPVAGPRWSRQWAQPRPPKRISMRSPKPHRRRKIGSATRTPRGRCCRARSTSPRPKAPRCCRISSSVSSSVDDAHIAEVYRFKLHTLEGEGGADAERGATQFLLAAALEKGGGEGEAAQLVDELTAAGNGRREDFGAMLAWRARARLEAKRGEWARAAEAWEQLARMAGSPAWSNAYLRRAAELWDSRVNDTARAEVLYARLHMAAPGDAAVAMVLARLRILRGAATEAAQVLETSGRARGPAGAAQVALAAAHRRWMANRPIRRSSAGARRLRPRVNAVRSRRSRAHTAAHTTKPRCSTRTSGSVLHPTSMHDAVRPILPLRARWPWRQRTPKRPRLRSPPPPTAILDDLLVHAGRVMLYRKYQKYSELATALKAIIGLVKSTQAQARLYRQLARVAGEHLGDKRRRTSTTRRRSSFSPTT